MFIFTQWDYYVASENDILKFIGPAPTREEQVQGLTEVEQDYKQYLERLPKGKRKRLYAHVNRMRHGLHAIAPRICPGPDNCIIIKHCPIPTRTDTGVLILGELKDYPISQSCVMEKFFLQQKIIDYVQHLNVNPSNPVEMSIVNELAIIDLMKNRALMILAAGDRDKQGTDFMRVDTTAYTEGGKAITRTQLHPVVEVMDKFEKRREKWLEKLNETRKAQAEIRLRAGSTEQPELLQEIQKVRGLLEDLSTREDLLDLNEKIPLDE